MCVRQSAGDWLLSRVTLLGVRTVYPPLAGSKGVLRRLALPVDFPGFVFVLSGRGTQVLLAWQKNKTNRKTLYRLSVPQPQNLPFLTFK